MEHYQLSIPVPITGKVMAAFDHEAGAKEYAGAP
jgi:hypothetical protein